MGRLSHIVSRATRSPPLGDLERKRCHRALYRIKCDIATRAALSIQLHLAELRLTPKGGWHMVLHKVRSEIPEGTQMKNLRLATFIGAIWLLLFSGSVLAHHGRSNYDVTAAATVKGIVTEFEWVNPHALIHLDVTGEDGKIEKWIAETNSPNTLSRQGWSKNTVKTGDEITLVGHRVKGGGNYINFSKITFADGRVLTPAIQN
jgi:hypothetical protein